MPPDLLQQALQLHKAGKLSEAHQLYRQALNANPKNHDALNLLGVLHIQLKKFDDAVQLISAALAITPNFPLAHYNLGNAYLCKHQPEPAIAAYQRALELKPDWPEVLCNLGNALISLQRFSEAAPHLARAVTLNPNIPEAHYSLAFALLQQRDLDAALDAYQKTAAFLPRYPKPAAYRRTTEDKITTFTSQADFAMVFNKIGNILKDQGRISAAVAAYRKAVECNPENTLAYDNLLLALWYDPASTPESILRDHAAWEEKIARPLARLIQPHSNNRDPHRRLRVGYVSPDFCRHTVGYNLLPLFQNHDHANFEIICYYNKSSSDQLTAEFQKHADLWRDVAADSDDALAQKIRDDHIDILVDLALHTAGNRLTLFAQKPAPVQLTFAGYPGTTGLTTIDYRISDPHLDPQNAQQLYSEKTLRLDHSFWCYQPPENSPPVSDLPALKNNHLTFGCFNNPCKINDTTLALWAPVLAALPTSRLLLIAHNSTSRRSEILRLLSIDPARIDFLPPTDRLAYFARFQLIDISLDTTPYNGHTTSLDSLWMGVPVLTCTGSTVVSRAAQSQLTNLNLPTFITRTPQNFLTRAKELAQNLPILSALRQSLRQSLLSSPLADAKHFTQNLESLYRTAWSQWCATP